MRDGNVIKSNLTSLAWRTTYGWSHASDPFQETKGREILGPCETLCSTGIAQMNLDHMCLCCWVIALPLPPLRCLEWKEAEKYDKGEGHDSEHHTALEHQVEQGMASFHRNYCLVSNLEHSMYTFSHSVTQLPECLVRVKNELSYVLFVKRMRLVAVHVITDNHTRLVITYSW